MMPRGEHVHDVALGDAVARRFASGLILGKMRSVTEDHLPRALGIVIAMPGRILFRHVVVSSVWFD